MHTIKGKGYKDTEKSADRFGEKIKQKVRIILVLVSTNRYSIEYLSVLYYNDKRSI